jgi:hypothetical protein
MTQEEKILVVKDLCSRLPFHVKVAIDFERYLEMLPDDENLQYPYRKNLKFILDRDNKTIEDISKEPNILYAYPCTERFQMLHGYTYELDYGVPVEFIKSYLRPMLSMTEEEKREFVQFHCVTLCPIIIDEMLTLNNESNMFDWLNEHHFDYRNLIKKGLALVAPEGMYKTKTE